MIKSKGKETLRGLDTLGRFSAIFYKGDTFATSLLKKVFDCVGFDDKSTRELHFVSSPREKEKRDKRDSRGDEKEG